MSKISIIEDLRKRKKEAEDTYYKYKEILINRESKNINKDYEKMSNALWDMEKLSNVLLEQEFADRRLIEELYNDEINTDPNDDIIDSGENDELIKG